MTNANVDLAANAVVAVEVSEDSEAVSARQELFAKRMNVRTVQAERSHAYARTHFGTESPEAKQTAKALAAQKFRSGRLAARLQVRKLVVPEANPESFTVYGRVSDASGMGVPGVIVRATDEAQRHLGQDKTDAQGAFLIRTSGNPNECCDDGKPAPPTSPTSPDPTAPDQPPVERAPAERTAADRAAAAARGIIAHLVDVRPPTPQPHASPSRVLYLSAEKDGKTVHRDATSTPIVLGRVVAREIQAASS